VSDETRCTPEEVDALYQKLEHDAEAHGYHLNPDGEFTRELIEGLASNNKRLGYAACPCRLASGDRDEDLDIICPCYYRDADLVEYGCCYCSLYVSEAALEGRQTPHSIPERRPSDEERAARASAAAASGGTDGASSGLGAPGFSPSIPVHRCRVCGYLCAREAPPAKCPICGASSDRFERFL
jgi:ferredoxin-thioredoxin reductase catalytic chain